MNDGSIAYRLEVYAARYVCLGVPKWRRHYLASRRDDIPTILHGIPYIIFALNLPFFLFFLCCRRECVACSFFVIAFSFVACWLIGFSFFFVAEKVIKFNEAVEASARTNLKAPIQSGESAYSPLSSY